MTNLNLDYVRRTDGDYEVRQNGQQTGLVITLSGNGSHWYIRRGAERVGDSRLCLDDAKGEAARIMGLVHRS